MKGRKEHGLGHGDTYALAGALLFLGTTAIPEQRTKIETWLTEHAPGSKLAQKTICLFRTEKMFNESHRRLMMSFRPEHAQFENLVVSLIEQFEGTTEFAGPRPAGWLEDTAQQLIKK